MALSGEHFVFLFSLILIIGVLTTKFSSRLGMPSLILFIAVGLVLNRFFYFDNVKLAQLFGIMALIVILFEGGLQARWKNVRPVLGTAISLATVGVFATTAVIGIAAKYILNVGWLEGMLFGAIVGSTDAAAVFASLGSKNIKKKLSSTLEAESGTNDPMAVFLTVTFIELITSPEAHYGVLIWHLIKEMGLGLLIGLLLGKLSITAIKRLDLESSGLYPVLAIGFAIFTYSSTTLVDGSGFLAVYVMGMVLGNARVPYRRSIIQFNEGLAWMMQILMFILLGWLVFPGELLGISGQAIILSLVLMFIARPIGVFLSMVFSKFSFKEKIFISWAGLKGAVPIVLATYPIMNGLENGRVFFNGVFFVVIISTLVQGLLISPLANKLELTDEEVPLRKSRSTELLTLGKDNSEIFEVILEQDSPAIGKQIRELNLPENVTIATIVREEKRINPQTEILLKKGDILFIIGSTEQQEEFDRLFIKDVGV